MKQKEALEIMKGFVVAELSFASAGYTMDSHPNTDLIADSKNAVVSANSTYGYGSTYEAAIEDYKQKVGEKLDADIADLEKKLAERRAAQGVV